MDILIIKIAVTVFVLLTIASISKAVMDTVDFRFDTSIFAKIKSEKWRRWFNQEQGWKNKYKDRDSTKGPAFWGSTTFFVWLTDSWHFFQMIMLTCYDLAILLPIFILTSLSWWFFAPTLMFMKMWKGGFFELFWDKIFKIKK